MEDGLIALQVLDVMSRTLEFAKKEIRSASKPSGKKKPEPEAAVEASSNGRSEIAGRIAEWLNREDLDDVSAGKLLGVHPTSVRTWRLDLGTPNVDSMKKIEKVLSAAGL